jgi:hypothetical protein
VQDLILTGLKEKEVVCVLLHELTDLYPADQAHLSLLLFSVHEEDFETIHALVVPQNLFLFWFPAHD